MSQQKKYIKMILKNFDFILFFSCIMASVIGIIAISSAVSTNDNSQQFIIIQTGALIIGIIAIICIVAVDYEHLCSMSYIIYGICIFLLLIVLIPGVGTGLTEKGSRSWIRFGAIGFQPAEFVKIGFILTFAKHLSILENEINKFKNIAALIVHVCILIFLILCQPDAGTALVFVSIFLVMIFLAGLSHKYIITAITAFLSFIPIAWFFILQDYQKNRIINFLYPENDPLGSGYQVVQSKITVGSGRIFGKGLYQGSTQFGFLPERHTDFIFSVISEEFGFIGSVFLVLLLFGIIGQCIFIAKNARNDLGSYIVFGVTAMLIFQVFENIGMCIGLMPVTGVTLPFVSYGGSSLITNMVAIGLVLNVRYRRKVINF